MVHIENEAPVVYIVEDDIAVLRSMKVLLEVKGFRVQTYGSGEAFLDALDVMEDGCLLLDLNLPGIDGVGVLMELARYKRDLPVLAMTGGADSIVRIRALELGALKVFDKPVAISNLVESLGAALAK